MKPDSDPEDLQPPAYEALIQFLYQAPIGLLQIRPDGTVTMMNPRSAQLLMPLARQGNLDNLFEVLDEVAPDLRAMADAAIEPGALVCEGLRMPVRSTAGGRRVLGISLLRLDAHTIMGCVNDVTHEVELEQQRLASRMRDASRTDSLTLMPNRSAVLERIQQALARPDAGGAPTFAVLFINCDRFNRVNLTLGQAGGDRLLRMVAERLNGTVRQRDAVGPAQEPLHTTARLGGDEFVVLLDGLRDSEDVHSIAQRLIDTLSRPYLIDSVEVHISASIGVVAGIHAAAEANALLQDASLAMQEAKRAGGGRHVLFTPSIKDIATRRGALELELRRALEQDELFVVYQPIVELTDGRVAGFEALVRWQHPQRGLVSPVEFIEIAEECGLIGAVGEFVLDSACRQLATWQRQFGALAPAMVSVNLSRAQLQDAAITDQVARVLDSSRLPAQALQLEVTESMAAQGDDIRARLLELKALGVALALDDFGTGYSSLACLGQLPIDTVKIDRSFVADAESNLHKRVLIEATVRVARSLGMSTTAEGIETEGQAALLATLDCNKGQGYLWSRPLAVNDATQWLAARIGAADLLSAETLPSAASPLRAASGFRA
ncbi:putative bifunctional diguanylate cyclase/phosphodiesterase [Methyloversatilis sp.]|uniref:putative bifunctional diguanylate cyclase/phosphodiesterase n=1 Tax=Methyloversatilis sp. TaxID=2569862 RepID=UPI003D2CBDE3